MVSITDSFRKTAPGRKTAETNENNSSWKRVDESIRSEKYLLQECDKQQDRKRHKKQILLDISRM